MSWRPDDDLLHDDDLPQESDLEAFGEDAADVDDEVDRCPHCGRSVHESAALCPHCRSWIDRSATRRTPTWIIVTVVLLLLAFGLFVVVR